MPWLVEVLRFTPFIWVSFFCVENSLNKNYSFTLAQFFGPFYSLFLCF